MAKCIQLQNILERDKFEGLNRKVQLKPLKHETMIREKDEEEIRTKVIQALFVLKWGGELTHAGESQAVKLGESFREKMYIEDKAGGLLRLHSTYRHDLKCYSSDEGRC